MRTICGLAARKRQVFRDMVAVFAQRLVFLAQLHLLPALQHRHVELGFFERLGQIILRAQADGLDDGGHFVRAGEHDHVQRPVHLHQLPQRLKPVHLLHQHVQDDEVRTVAFLHRFESFRSGSHGRSPDSRPPRAASADTFVCSVRRPPPEFFLFQPFASPLFFEQNSIDPQLFIGRSRNVNVQPRRGSLSTQILPRCACTSRLAIASPSPIPDEVRSTRTKSSKISW